MKVQSLTVAFPPLLSTAPPLLFAELFAKTSLATVSDPEFSMAPPDAPEAFAVLPEMVELLSVSVPELKIAAAPLRRLAD